MKNAKDMDKLLDRKDQDPKIVKSIKDKKKALQNDKIIRK